MNDALTLRIPVDDAFHKLLSSGAGQAAKPVSVVAIAAPLGVATAVAVLAYFVLSSLDRFSDHTGSLALVLSALSLGFSAGHLTAFYAHLNPFRPTARLKAAFAEAAGELVLHLGPDGATVQSSHIETRICWPAVTRIIHDMDGVILIASGLPLPIPSAALPEGLRTSDLKARLETWRGAAA